MFIILQLFAHKKGGGSTKNGRDSAGKRLGAKAFGGEFVTAGSIIIRQRGNAIKAGDNVGTGRDYTLFALKDGTVAFKKTTGDRKVVYVEEVKAAKEVKAVKVPAKSAVKAEVVKKAEVKPTAAKTAPAKAEAVSTKIAAPKAAAVKPATKTAAVKKA